MTEAPTSVVLRFLAEQTNWLAHRPESLEAFAELRAVAELFRNAIDQPRLVYAGPCDVCGRDMYARDGKAVVECRPCALEYDLAPRQAMLLGLVVDMLAPAADIHRGLSDLGEIVTDTAIRKWAERDRILVRGIDGKGRPLYRVGDVIELARRARKDRTA